MSTFPPGMPGAGDHPPTADQQECRSRPVVRPDDETPLAREAEKGENSPVPRGELARPSVQK